MTKDKLEELGALARDLKDRNANLWAATEMEAFASKGPQAADCLLRVLEERARLLEAASNVRVSLLMLLENPDDPPTTATLAEYAALLRTAIAFAEAR